MKILLFTAILICLSISCSKPKSTTIRYAVADTPWEMVIEDDSRQKARTDSQPSARNHNSFGNHRALIRVPRGGAAARLDLEWRRHDKGVDKARFIIIHAESQDTVKNIYRSDINNEHCKIVFGPVTAGDYYFYYLPFEIQGGWGGYNKRYVSPEAPPAESWLKENQVTEGNGEHLIQAECIEIQARTEFDSFYPMEVIATEKEKSTLIAAHENEKFLLFPEDRKYPIRMLDNIPQKWILNPMGNTFDGVAAKNEYYVFQIGLWALDELEGIKVEFQPLTGKGFTLPADSMTCFNTGGIDASGNAFSKTVNVAKGKVQPLWMGLDLPAEMPPGNYQGSLTIMTGNAGHKEISIRLKVTGEVIADRGDNEPWRHSRLRWLNSTVGIDDNPVLPYQPIEVSDNLLKLNGKQITFSSDGLPTSITAFGEEVLADPILFNIEATGVKMKFGNARTTVLKQSKNLISKEVSQSNDEINLKTRSEVEADGWMKYFFEIEALKDVDFSDIRLKIPYKKKNSVYLSGMDLFGVETPDNHDAKWDYHTVRMDNRRRVLRSYQCLESLGHLWYC